MWKKFGHYPVGLGLGTLGAGLIVTAQLLVVPSTPTGQDCAARLSNPAPLSTPDREFLERCVSAFTVPTPAPTTTTPPTTTTSTPPPPTTTPPIPQAWPNPGNTGVPAFWQPVTTRSTTLTVTTPGAVVQDVLFTGSAGINIRANNVTVRRVLLQGGKVDGGSGCSTFHLDQVTFVRPPNANGDLPTVQHGSYTADRVKMDGVTEGFRIGGRSAFACGPVSISNSWIRVQSEEQCADWHGDGAQGYDGNVVIVRNVAMWLDERGGCGGTAPFFYPRNQGNTSVDIDRLLVKGGGFSFRNGMPGTVRNLKIVEDWGYGPIDVRCSVLTTWQAHIVTVDSAWQPTNVRVQACNTESGY